MSRTRAIVGTVTGPSTFLALTARLRAAEQRLALLKGADEPMVIAVDGGALTLCSGPLLDAWRRLPKSYLPSIRIVGSV